MAADVARIVADEEAIHRRRMGPTRTAGHIRTLARMPIPCIRIPILITMGREQWFTEDTGIGGKSRLTISGTWRGHGLEMRGGRCE